MIDQITFARRLRREQTPAEHRFWALLHPYRVSGWHWRRQAPVGPYVVDFICKRARLIIEIDGDSHYDAPGMEYDAQRSADLHQRGYAVLRFTNHEVLGNDEGVFDALRRTLGEPGATPT